MSKLQSLIKYAPSCQSLRAMVSIASLTERDSETQNRRATGGQKKNGVTGRQSQQSIRPLISCPRDAAILSVGTSRPRSGSRRRRSSIRQRLIVFWRELLIVTPQHRLAKQLKPSVAQHRPRHQIYGLSR